MKFLRYIINKKNFKEVISILIFFILFYFILNFNIINFLINENIIIGPFDYTYFKFNIFNMDPIQLKNITGTIMHPFFNFISLAITPFKIHKESMWIILFIQSFISSINVVLIYCYCFNLKLNKHIAILISLFFGVFSYGINSTLVPDTYIYAQFFLILTVVYFQYCRKEKIYGILGHAILGFFNFGVTITNIIPYTLSVFINKCENKKSKWIIKIIKSILLCFIFIIIFISIQHYFLNGSFLDNWIKDLNNGGISYTEKFNLYKHWKIVYFMFTSPIITGPLKVMPNTQGIVTDITTQFPLYLNIITVILLLLTFTSIIINIKEKDTWILLSFILTAIFLHIILGFGLAVFEYDMYLYAGHFIFTIPLYIALLFKKIKNNNVITLLAVILLVIFLITLINNIFMQNEIFNIIKKTYL